MSALVSEQDRKSFDDLVNALSEETVIGLCGAGPSVPIGYPTWQNLMELMVDHLESNSRIPLPAGLREVVKTEKTSLPLLAQFVRNLMQGDEYTEFIKNTFLPHGNIDLSYEYECLVCLPVRLWTTTNYDLCLSEALRNHLQQNINQLQEIPFAELLKERNTLPKVVHFHGAVTRPEAVILTSDDYTEYYQRNPLLTQTFSGLGPLTLFFVGYGLGEDEINNCLKRTRAILGTSAITHYALLPRFPSQRGIELELRKAELLRQGIKPIFYDPIDEKHSGRLDVIAELIKRLDNTLPSSREELTFRWTHAQMSSNQFRRLLKELRDEGNLSSPLTVRCLSFKEKAATIAVNNADDFEKLKNTLEKSKDLNISTKGILIDPISESKIPSTERHIVVEGESKFLKIPQSILQKGSIVNTRHFDDVDVDKTKDEETEDISEESEYQVETSSTKYHAKSHAEALGLTRPPSTEEVEVGKPLMPPKLEFGLADCFHPAIDWRLDSPVIHAWVYNQKKADSEQSTQPLAVTIIGTGLESIYQRIENAVFASIFALSDSDTDVILTKGFIHISSLNAVKSVSSKPKNILRRLINAVRPAGGAQTTIPAGAQEAIENIVSLLAKLSNDTGFVQLRDAEYDKLRNFLSTIRTDLDQAENKGLKIRPPKKTDRVVTFLPLPLFPYHVNPKIPLQLSGDLLDTPTFRSLIDAYYRKVVLRMVADLERRIQFWRDELRRYREQVRWFKSLSEEEQRKQPDVITNRFIDKEFAIEIPTEEERVPATVYYLDHVQNHQIPIAEGELELLEANWDPLKRLAEESYSLLWRKCLSQIFDCAIRRAPLSSDPKINSLFERWRVQIDNVLRLEWNRLLQRCGIENSAVFKRITFFDTEYDEIQRIITIFPYVVIDTSRSTLIIDKNRKTLLVEDIIDNAENVKDLSNGPAEFDPNINDILESTESDSAKTKKIKNLIYRTPRVLDNIFDGLFPQNQTDFAYKELRKDVLSHAKSTKAGERSFRLLNELAYNTAVECLQPEDEYHQSPSKALAIAVLNCLRKGYDPQEELRNLRHNPSYSLPQDIKTPFQKALRINKEQVDFYLNESNLIPDGMRLAPAQQKVWDIEHSIETSLLAEHLFKAAASLDVEGESLNTAFLKVEEAFEAVHSSVFSRPTFSLYRIQRILTGEPMRP